METNAISRIDARRVSYLDVTGDGAADVETIR